MAESKAKYNLEDPRQLAAFVQYADIRLVRTKYLYELRSQNKLLPRRQEADEWGLVSHEEVSEWAAGSRDAMMISISHAWETREHPDPCGDQLNRMVDRLCLYDAAYESEIWVFYDYVSLFQFERQTSAEEESFRRSMSHMHVLYAHNCNWTFRLESLTPDDVWDAALQNSEHLVMVYDVTSKTVRGCPLNKLVANRVPYRSRGWCKAEVEWSSCRSRSEQNQRIDAPQSKDRIESRYRQGQRALLQGKVPMAPEVFEEDMKKAAFTHRDDAAEVQKLQRDVYHVKVAACSEALLANLPSGELGQLAKALKDYKRLNVLRLRNIEVGDAEAEDFAKALALNDTITELKVSKVSEFPPSTGARCNPLWKALADALTINRTICSISLPYNYFGDEGCKAFAGALKSNGGITSIDLSWNRIGPRGSQALADALMVNRAITSINLRSNNIGDEGCEALADALKTNTTISSINLEMNGIGAQGGKAVADALKSNDSIASIQLERNSIDDELRKEIDAALKTRTAATHSTDVTVDSADATTSQHAWTGRVRIEELASEVKTHSSITTLRLPTIDDEGCKAVADALKTSRAITTIELFQNIIGDDGWKALADALRVNRSITGILVLRSIVGDEGCKAFADALKINATITNIHFNMNGIGAEGGKALAEALKVNQAVTDISLAFNRIGAEGGKALADALKTNTAITSIDLENNEIAHEGCEALADALKTNTSIRRINLAGNDVSELELVSFPSSVRKRLEGVTTCESLTWQEPCRQGCTPGLLSRLCLRPCLRLVQTTALSCLRPATRTPS